MPEYKVIDKATGNVVYPSYTADAPVEWHGMEFATHDHVKISDGPGAEPIAPVFGGRRVLTKLEFRSLFSPSALQGIDRFEAQFEQSPFLTDTQKDAVRTAFADYRAAEGVNLDDPRWVPGLGLYVGLGIMTSAEMDEVLRG